MKIIDTHCDTITCLYEQNKSLSDNDLHISLNKMSKYGAYVQFFAVFSDPAYRSNACERTLEIIDRLYCEIEKNSDRIALCTTKKDMYRAIYAKKNVAFLSLEGAEAIVNFAMLRNFYRLGVRCIAPTWNVSNHIASSVAEDNPKYGLTEFGVRLLAETDRLKIITDVSHISEKAFWDIAQRAKLPFIASHSNSKSLCAHRRNLTDEQFTAIKNSGGCVGINLYPPFLKNDGNAGICDVIRHIEHFMSLDGEDSIGIGSDFDGVDSLPRGIDGVADTDKIFNELLRLGYKNSVVEKIAWGNFNRVLAVLD